MNVQFEKTPAMFGTEHVVSLVLIAALAVSMRFVMRKKEEKTLVRLIFALGLVMAVTEVWKQWFSAVYVYPDVFSMWFFPWQLCDMAMYCSLLLPFSKGRFRDALLTFLATFSLFSALIALAIPSDMLRPHILLFIHGFLYHGLMIVEALAAVLILKNRSRQRFLPAVGLFFAMAAVAEVINVISHHVIRDIHYEANMFYITPYYETTQVVLHDIAVRWGIFAEIVLYLFLIVLMSGLFFLVEKMCCFRGGRKKHTEKENA